MTCNRIWTESNENAATCAAVQELCRSSSSLFPSCVLPQLIARVSSEYLCLWVLYGLQITPVVQETAGHGDTSM